MNTYSHIAESQSEIVGLGLWGTRTRDPGPSSSGIAPDLVQHTQRNADLGKLRQEEPNRGEEVYMDHVFAYFLSTSLLRGRISLCGVASDTWHNSREHPKKSLTDRGYFA